MTNNKANKSKILALILGLTMCLSLMLGIVFASPTSTVYAEGGTGTTGGLIIDGTGDITSPDRAYAYTNTDRTLTLNGYSGGVIRFNADNDVMKSLPFCRIKKGKSNGSHPIPEELRWKTES